MGSCTKIRRRHRKICIGDLDTLINIHSRTSSLKNFNADVELAIYTSPWALWETLTGVQVFDETNVGVEATDMAIIRYDPNITKEFFVELNGENFRILTVEDLDRRKEWTKMILTNRGPITEAVNGA